MKAVLEIIWKYEGTLEKRLCLHVVVVMAIKLHMMLQNSRKACSLDRAKEGISSGCKTKIRKQKEGERPCEKVFQWYQKDTDLLYDFFCPFQ